MDGPSLPQSSPMGCQGAGGPAASTLTTNDALGLRWEVSIIAMVTSADLLVARASAIKNKKNLSVYGQLFYLLFI